MSTTTYQFAVTGMHCASCGMLIDDTLEDLDGVTRAQTSVKTGRTSVQADPDRCQPADVIAAIAQAGYTATPLP